MAECERLGAGGAYLCVAKTPYSFSDDPVAVGRPTGFELRIREVHLLAGAGFVVPLAGEVQTMPGLPREPNLQRMEPSG